MEVRITKPKGEAEKGPAVYRRGVVFCLLFLVLGPLAIPILIKSPCFSDAEKWVFSVMVIVLTILFVVLLVWVFFAVLNHIHELRGIFELE